MGGETTFVADENLRRLTRWLRLAGRDVIFRNPFPDSDLLGLAEREDRVVLTMDKGLARRLRKDRCVRIRSYEVEEQFLQVFRAYPGDPLEKAFSRCALCNALLRPASDEEVADRVPPGARELGGEYRSCPGCRKVFWEGTHFKRMMARLESLRREMGR